MVVSVDELRSSISSKGGLARPNRFQVELPGSSELLAGTGLALPELSLYCKRVNMPGKQIFSVDRRVGATFQKIAYGYGSNDVQMAFHLTNGLAYKRYFENWQQLAVDNLEGSAWHGPKYKNEYARLVTIHQLNSDEQKRHSVELIDAYPTTVNQIDFSDDAENTAMELTVELSFVRWHTKNL